MQHFQIKEPDHAIAAALQSKIDHLTKPKGSLGMLEEIAFHVGLVQQTLEPEFKRPQNLLFAGDHGILTEGVSVTPREVTLQQVIHYAKGGAGINFLCDQHGFSLKIVDAGIDGDVPYELGIYNHKIRRGTRNFLHGPAMTEEEMELAIEAGAHMADMAIEEGSNVLSFGEMGAGNTSSASIWMHFFTHQPLALCIGAGSGLNKEGVNHKREVLTRAVNNYQGNGSPENIISYFGGYELVMAIGAMMRSAEKGVLLLIDGFLMTSCILAAMQLNPAIKSYALFGHQGDEGGHRLMLESMGAKPILKLNLRLGEGTGAVCAYPIVDSAIRMLREMDSFSQASVNKYF